MRRNTINEGVREANRRKRQRGIPRHIIKAVIIRNTIDRCTFDSLHGFGHVITHNRYRSHNLDDNIIGNVDGVEGDFGGIRSVIDGRCSR